MGRIHRFAVVLAIPVLLSAAGYVACSPFSGQDSTAGGADAGDAATVSDVTDAGAERAEAGEVVIATGEDQPTAIAADTTGVYWVNHGDGKIRQAALGTLAVTTAYDTTKSPLTVALGNGFIVVGDEGAGTITHGTEPGSNSVTTALDGGGPIAMTYSSMLQTFYWLGLDHSLHTFDPRAGASSSQIGSSNSGNPFDLAADGKALYVTDVGGSAIDKVDVSGGQPVYTKPFPGQSGCQSIAAFNGAIAWTSAGSHTVTFAAADGTIRGVALNQDAPLSIAMDASGVYWLDMTSGELRHAAIDGSSVATIATGDVQTGATTIGYFHGVALDASYVYRISYGDGTIKRTPKP